jgi:hypothetical protein
MIGRFARRNEPKPEAIEVDDRVRRDPVPLARAILWKPLPDSYHLLASMMRAPEEQAQLFVTQRAFLQVERHLRSAPELELGGFLAGHRCLCPRTGKRYSVVNTILPFADVSDQPLGSRVTAEAHAKVQRRLDAHGLALIGWYRNGNGLGLQLLPDDIETHLAYFNQPWQTAMLVLPDPSKPKGAFFTYDPRVGRSYCIPFYELFDVHAAESNRLERTCVTWTTYVPSTSVEPLAAREREVVEATVAPTRSEPEPQPPEPIDEWLDAIKDPWIRLKDVAVGPSRRDAPLPLVYESTASSAPGAYEPLKPPPAPLKPAPVPTPAAPVPNKPELVPPPVAAAKPQEMAPPEVTRRAPPFAGPARPASPVSSPASPAALRPAPKPRAIPPATMAALERAAAPPPVALPPGFHDDAKRWERRRRIGFAVAAASFLAVIVLSAVRSRSQTVAQAATSAIVSHEDSVRVVSDSEHTAEPLPLSTAVDSLSAALSYYRAVSDDHVQGRVGCRVLDRAYTLVGRARARVSQAREKVTGQLADADSIRVSMLGAEYTHVAQTYRRSGCQS